MKESILKHKPLVITLCIIIIAGLGFGAGMLAKTSMADSGSAHGYIGVSQAKTIALESVGVSPSKATFTKATLENDRGTMLYLVKFYTASSDYTLEIDAKSGVLMRKDSAKHKSSKDATDEKGNKIQSGGSDSSTLGYIGVAKAKQIAFRHAGVSASGAQITKAKLDSDDGVRTYEIEFISGSREYDYEINATNGAIMDYDVENHGTTYRHTDSSNDGSASQSTKPSANHNDSYNNHDDDDDDDDDDRDRDRDDHDDDSDDDDDDDDD